jgi:hypothetical protein
MDWQRQAEAWKERADRLRAYLHNAFVRGFIASQGGGVPAPEAMKQLAAQALLAIEKIESGQAEQEAEDQPKISVVSEQEAKSILRKRKKGKKR